MGNKETLNLLIMANSNKRRPDNTFGRCVAAVTLNGEWIRLVADKEGNSIQENDVRGIKLLTVVMAEIERAPLIYQNENAILLKKLDIIQENKDNYLKNIKHIDELGIFGNTSNHLSIHEINNGVGGTLRYISVDELSTYRGESDGDKCKAMFLYQKNTYEEMAMTDPNWYAAKGTTRKIGKARIVVSIPNTPPFNKFIAAIHLP